MLINISQLKSALLTGLYCGAFGVGTLVLQATVSKPAVGQDALNALQENTPAEATGQPTAEQQQAEQQEARKKQLGVAFYKELDSLVPGEQTEGSPAAEALHTAVDSFIQRKPAMTLEILKQAVANNAGFPPAELLMAGLYLAAKDQKNGLQNLQQAAIESPDNPAVYAAYGRLAYGTTRYVDAMVHFEKLLSLLDKVEDPTAVAHYENEYLEGMSQTAIRLKRYDLARNLSEQLLKRKPDSTNPLQLLARVAFEEGNLEEATANLLKLREKNPDTRVPEAVIGMWFARANKKAMADQWMDKLPAAYPKDPGVQLEYAAWTLGQEDIANASAAIARAEAIEPENTNLKVIKGKIAFYQRKYEDAVAIFKALHEADPGNTEIVNMYMLSLIESGTTENSTLANKLANDLANKLAKTKSQANPNNRVALATIGYVRLRTVPINDQLRAIFSQVAKTRDGRSPEVDYFLANFLKDAGNAQSAFLVLQQASKYPGLFLYRNQADQMKQALAAAAANLPTP